MRVLDLAPTPRGGGGVVVVIPAQAGIQFQISNLKFQISNPSPSDLPYRSYESDFS